MKNKYYTPNISEISYGTELEYLQPMIEKGKKREWIKHSFGKGIFDGIGLSRLSIGNFTVKYRIKYLDKEDIEDLNFIKSNVNKYDCDHVEFVEGYCLEITDKISYTLHNIKGNKYVIYKSTVYNETTGNWNQEDIFIGTIRNKSEFKTLLIQLGIIDEK